PDAPRGLQRLHPRPVRGGWEDQQRLRIVEHAHRELQPRRQSLMLALGFVTTRKVDLPKSNWGMNDRFVLRLLNVASSERYLEEIDFMSVRKAASLWKGDHRQASRADHIPVSREMIDELAPENDPLRRT